MGWCGLNIHMHPAAGITEGQAQVHGGFYLKQQLECIIVQALVTPQNVLQISSTKKNIYKYIKFKMKTFKCISEKRGHWPQFTYNIYDF